MTAPAEDALPPGPAESRAVVGLPLPVVEQYLLDPTRWTGFLGDLVAVEPVSFERFAVTVQQGRRRHHVLVAVRRDTTRHRISWRALEGATWDGSLRLTGVTGRRTAIVLARRAEPRSLLAGAAGLFGAGRVDTGLDLLRLQDRLATIPAPARPTRLRPVSAAERAARTARIAASSERVAPPVVPPVVPAG